MSTGAEAHPAPARDRTANRALWFGLFGAPAAWSVQTLVNLAVAAHACYPRLEPLASPMIPGVRVIVIVVSAIALLVAASATVVAWRAWSHTRREHHENSGRASRHGHHTAVLETGEGRTRFMAFAGFMMSVTFLLLSAAHVATVLFVAPCA